MNVSSHSTSLSLLCCLSSTLSRFTAFIGRTPSVELFFKSSDIQYMCAVCSLWQGHISFIKVRYCRRSVITVKWVMSYRGGSPQGKVAFIEKKSLASNSNSPHGGSALLKVRPVGQAFNLLGMHSHILTALVRNWNPNYLKHTSWLIDEIDSTAMIMKLTLRLAKDVESMKSTASGGKVEPPF